MVNMIDKVEVAFPKNAQEQDILEDKKLLEFRLRDIMSRMNSLELMQQEYTQFCQKHNIILDSTGVEVSNFIKEIMSKVLQDVQSNRFYGACY